MTEAPGEDRAIRIASAGHAVFALTMIGLGVYGLIKGDFTAPWDPVPMSFPARHTLIYLCGFISLASGIGLLWRRTAGRAAGVLLAALLLWLLVFRVPDVVRAPGVEGYWWGCGGVGVMAAAAWVLYAWFAPDSHRRRFGFLAGDKGLRIARMFYGLALIPFGLAHFVYLRNTVTLVPRWLPWHLAWAYLTGAAFIVAGVAVLIGVCARLAAALSTLELGLFTVLVWVPILAAGSKEPYQWSETILSAALTAGAWVVTDSYRPIPWLAANQPDPSLPDPAPQP